MLFLVICASWAYDNGVGRLPNMGWNPWNSFGCNVNEDLIKSSAQRIIDTNLSKLGYTVITLDDCWAEGRKGGAIQPSAKGFPSGMKALGDWLHAKGLKFGIYSSSGTATCEGRPGSLNFEEQDAKDYASWGVDFLKYDDCGGDGGYSYLDRYSRMSRALNKTGRSIFYSITSGRGNLVRLIGSQNIKKISNSFTNFESGDFYDNWNSFVKHLREQANQHNIPGPFGWANPDMLQVGNPGMSYTEQETHFAMWALLKAPLVIGCDINNITPATLTILANEELIKINQDPLGRPAQLVASVKNGTHEYDTWAARLSNDEWAVAVINLSNQTTSASFETKTIKLKNAQGRVRDLLAHVELSELTRAPITFSIPSHGIKVIKIYGIFGDSPKAAEQEQRVQREVAAI
jgi:alpha-galactosidase